MARRKSEDAHFVDGAIETVRATGVRRHGDAESTRRSLHRVGDGTGRHAVDVKSANAIVAHERQMRPRGRSGGRPTKGACAVEQTSDECDIRDVKAKDPPAVRVEPAIVSQAVGAGEGSKRLDPQFEPEIVGPRGGDGLDGKAVKVNAPSAARIR